MNIRDAHIKRVANLLFFDGFSAMNPSTPADNYECGPLLMTFNISAP